MPVSNSSDLPLVTFLSPCYNHEQYVVQSLDSIRLQTYPNIHHIIIDDASKDNSVSVIEQWIRQHNYDCTFIRHEQNKGISKTLNESIALLKGDLWTCISTDDYVHPTRTERFVNFLALNPQCGMVASDMLMVDDNGKEVEVQGSSSFLKSCTRYHPAFNKHEFGSYNTLLFGNYVPGSLMVRKSAFEKVGGFNEELRIEDWDMWLRIANLGPIGFIDECLSYYRRHPSNTVNQQQTMNKDAVAVLMKQKSVCAAAQKEPLFEKAYKFHFSYLFDYRRPEIIKELFRKSGAALFFKGLMAKITGAVTRQVKT